MSYMGIPPEKSGQPKEALDNWSPVEAVPCANWELRTLAGAAEGGARTFLRLSFQTIAVSPQMHLLILKDSPQSLDKDVAKTPFLARPADLDLFRLPTLHKVDASELRYPFREWDDH
jgi:hypothetical protein